MKLDPTVLRTLEGTDVRVLEAIETGMKHHALVPVALIVSTASLRHGGTNKSLSRLLRDKLVSHDKSCGYDGYRVTTAGYDILALYHLKKRGFVAGLGDRIGTGKESDVYLGIQQDGQYVVLKFHRLGRTSFRNVKKLRDYGMYNGKQTSGRRGTKNSNPGSANGTSSNSWLFFSRTSAHKEYAFLQALYDVDYPTPVPVTCHRHIVVMSLIRGVPLYQLPSSQVSAEQAASIGKQATDLAVRLARHGLIHCDLNEFNLMVDMSGVQQRIATKSQLEKKLAAAAAAAGNDAQSMANGTTVSRRKIQSSMYLNGDPDPYVRHSGLSVAASKTPGMLSARGPWEPKETSQFAPANEYDDSHMIQNHEEANDDDDAEPAELLENGQPKPIVTLIDFPQMVSTKHPNAKELYERDMMCLYRFFTHKWQCQIPTGGDDEEDDTLCLTWELLQSRIARLEQKQQRRKEEEKAIQEDASEDGGASETDIDELCLASQAQLRLDEELKASGYSAEDASRDMELYYIATGNIGAVGDEKKDSVDDTHGLNSETDVLEEKQTIDDNNAKEADRMNDIDEESEEEDIADSGPSPDPAHQIIVSPEHLVKMSREQLQEQAKLRVQQQLEAQKRKGKQRGAFRKHNSNKTYLKGKRVYTDFGI